MFSICVVAAFGLTLHAGCSTEEPATSEKDDAQAVADSTVADGVAADGATGEDGTAERGDTTAEADVGCTTAADCTPPSNPCLQAVCDPGFGCKLDVRADETACDDGDKCTSDEKCANGTCTPAQGASCDDDNACTNDACDPGTGECVHNAKIDGAKCDDNDACTGTNDTCQAGKCTGGANQCECDKDEDCKAFEDNNPCNGTLHCVAGDGIGQCKVDVKTVVVCATKDDSECMKSQCEPATGKCAIGPVNGVVGCDDGQVCTNNDQCKIGKCVGVYFCECEAKADCAKKEDGDPCNGTLVCAPDHTCKIDAATVVKCDPKTSNACTVGKCDAQTGKCGEQPVLNGNPCDDGDPCMGPDLCQAGECKGTKKSCGCIDDSDCPDDGSKCNGVPSCDPKTHECAVDPASAVTCVETDGNSCTVPTCDPAQGSCAEKPANAGKSCNDGDACTGGESCKDGACGLGKAVTDCDDKDPCTTDACNPKTASCEHVVIPNCSTQTDAVPIPQEASQIFSWLVAKKYKDSYTGESKVHTGSIHAPVRAWFSPALFKSLTDGNAKHPLGAAAVKELYNNDQTTLKGWAVNIKVEDNGQNTDWYSYEVFSTTNGSSPAADGKGVSLCVSCHKSGKDFILSKFPLL